jgi:putative hydrolase of the HAD superfamily
MDALLLDLDDTLLDYSGDADRSWAEACRARCGAAGVDAERLIPVLAESRRWFWSDPDRNRRERVQMLRAWHNIVAHALGRLGAGHDALAGTIARDYAARRRERMRLFPEALECLEHLRRRGVVLALVTNGDATQQRDKIERHGLARFFATIVIEGEFGAGKPDESVYRHALGALGAAPGAAAMVGDNLEFDVEGAQRLGIHGVWIDRAGVGLPADTAVRPHRIIRSLRELVDQA